MSLTIRGEYWIIDGDPQYADGDVGDVNHECYALDHLRRKVLDAVDLCQDEYDWDEIVQEIPEALNDTLDLGIEEFDEPFYQGDILDELVKFSSRLQLDPEDLEYAFERTNEDIRDYMARKYGWIVCHGDNFGVWYLTADALAIIGEAAGEILSQEGSLDDDDDEDAELEIFVASTTKSYSVSWKALERGDFSEIPLKEIVPEIGPNSQVAAMDREIEHPYYSEKHA